MATTAASPIEEVAQMEQFFQELDNLQISIPAGSILSFYDNEKMLKLLRQQCPNWEEKVSSVPIGRVPLLFLQNTQMSTQQQEKFKLLQKGERGESKVYQMLMHDEKQKGMLVFPNLNGREIFKSRIAQVEIDTVIAHATKGFFVFVVKNSGGKGLTPQKMQSDIDRHCNFIRLLIEYGQTNPDKSMPIYPVVCLLHDDSKQRFQSLSFNGETDILILSKTDLTMENFSLEWGRYLDGLPNHNIDKDVFDLRVARLVAFMLRDGSGTIIHNKMNTNYMQAIRKNKLQFKDFDYPLKSIMEKASQIKFGGRERIVLWTVEQIEIIKRVVDHLMNPDQTGSLRLIVDGCKGSGKTMLLLFFAKIAHQVLLLRADQEDREDLCADQEDKEALSADQEDKEALSADQEDKEALSADQEDKEALSADQEDKEALSADQEDKEALSADQEDKEALSADQEDKEALSADQEDKEALSADQEDKEALSADQEDKEALRADREDKEDLWADQEDKEALRADQEDKEALSADQEDKVLVCNAHFLFATELTKLLKKSLSTCGVSVFDPAGEMKKNK